MDTSKLNDVIKFYSITTNKNRLDINKLLSKAQVRGLTDLESKRLNQYAFKSRMYFCSVSSAVDRKMDRLERESIMCTGEANERPNGTHKIRLR